MENLDLPLKICSSACDDLNSKLTKLVTHSVTDRMATVDKLRMYLNKSDIAILRENLTATKGTLQVALNAPAL